MSITSSLAPSRIIPLNLESTLRLNIIPLPKITINSSLTNRITKLLFLTGFRILKMKLLSLALELAQSKLHKDYLTTFKTISASHHLVSSLFYLLRLMRILNLLNITSQTITSINNFPANKILNARNEMFLMNKQNNSVFNQKR